MQGHVHKRGEARYSIVVELGRDPATGRRKQKWQSGYKTKAEAQKALRAKLKTLDDGGDPFPEAVSVRDFVTVRWLPFLRQQGRLRPGTVENYHQIWRDHALPVIGAMQLRAVRVGDVQGVLDAMTARGRAAGTVGHARAAMSAAFTQACRWELIPTNPARYAEPPARPVVKPWGPNPEELRAIVAAAAGSKYEIALLLSAGTGARRNEVLGLRWKDLDLVLGRVTISEALAIVDGRPTWTLPKTAKSIRTIPLRTETLDRLRAHRKEQAERLLALGIRQTGETVVADNGTGQPLRPWNYTTAAKRIAAAAGVAECHLHALRHGVGSALSNTGDLAVASEILGHSSLSFTHSIYVHADDARIERNGEALERALGGTPS